MTEYRNWKTWELKHGSIDTSGFCIRTQFKLKLSNKEYALLIFFNVYMYNTRISCSSSTGVITIVNHPDNLSQTLRFSFPQILIHPLRIRHQAKFP